MEEQSVTDTQAPSKKCVLEIVRRDGTHEQPYALQVVADDRRWDLAYLPANFEIRNTLEPRATPVAWRKALDPQYDYSDRYRYRDDTGIGAPEGWEPLYRSAPPPAPAPCEHEWSAVRQLHECLKGCGCVMSARTGVIRAALTKPVAPYGPPFTTDVP